SNQAASQPRLLARNAVRIDIVGGSVDNDAYRLHAPLTMVAGAVADGLHRISGPRGLLRKAGAHGLRGWRQLDPPDFASDVDIQCCMRVSHVDFRDRAFELENLFVRP